MYKYLFIYQISPMQYNKVLNTRLVGNYKLIKVLSLYSTRCFGVALGVDHAFRAFQIVFSPII